VCLGEFGDLHPGKQRLPSLRRTGRLRSTPELHRSCGGEWVHVQHGPRVQCLRQYMREFDDACHVLEGCAELRVPIGKHDVHERYLQRDRMLHQHLQPRSNGVHQQRACDVHAGSQRLLVLRHASSLRPAPKLHRDGGVGFVHVQHGPRLR